MRRYTLVINGKEFVVDVQELGGEHFQVLLDGEAFEVALTGDEALTDIAMTPARALETAAQDGAAIRPPAPSASPRPTPTPVPTRPAAPAASSFSSPGDGMSALLTAPMPGVILAVDVTVGAHVKRGDVLAVLEAMKMNNAIRSPRDGVVAEVFIQPGQAVVHGDALIRFEDLRP
jgi:biotin carboxyl carrier protein